MAFLALVGGISGDLNSATYQYGFFDDTVLVVAREPLTGKDLAERLVALA